MAVSEAVAEQNVVAEAQSRALAGEPGAQQCANCREPLLGPHCYACGQPVKGMVRHFHVIAADFFNTVFGLDSRIARTLGPLLLRPGFLSNEYFAGRRVRYVSPVQLFVFLCLLAFFAAQISTDWSGSGLGLGKEITREGGRKSALSGVEGSIAEAQTVEEVEQVRDRALEEIAEVSRESGHIPGVSGAMSGVEQVVLQRARLRIEELRRAEPGLPAAPEREEAPLWQPEVNPVQVDGLPDAANEWFSRQADRMGGNIRRIQQDPNLFKRALFGAIPSTLFVMLPLFAFLLCPLYLFKRRLYMEHLIVALHSHAFLSLALLLIVFVTGLGRWLSESHPLASALCNWLRIALIAWMPLYLLLMQKRVYGQGWPMTLLKFYVIGLTYLILLGAAAALTALASLVRL